MRCLVIEDEADTARYICNGLEEAGHTATLVRDGGNGLHLATNERWDIIILGVTPMAAGAATAFYPPAAAVVSR